MWIDWLIDRICKHTMYMYMYHDIFLFFSFLTCDFLLLVTFNLKKFFFFQVKAFSYFAFAATRGHIDSGMMVAMYNMRGHPNARQDSKNAVEYVGIHVYYYWLNFIGLAQYSCVYYICVHVTHLFVSGGLVMSVRKILH